VAEFMSLDVAVLLYPEFKKRLYGLDEAAAV
jgi:hypothetical protein